MHDCPCCGFAVYSADGSEICSDCVIATCEPNKKGVYDCCKSDLIPDPFEDIG